jgi:putative ABC transport system permease protein
MTAVEIGRAATARSRGAGAGRSTRLRLALRFALREMRGGLSGFYIFLACITLGVASIAAVNSVSSMMTEGIEREGRAILGGDIRFQLVQRELSPEERAYVEDLGTVSMASDMRSMVRNATGAGDPTLVEVKAVDDAYPLYGAVELDRPEPLSALLSERNGRYGAVAAPELYDRMGLQPGAVLRLGAIEVELRGVLKREPDLLSDGFTFAPRLMILRPALAATGLVQPGSLVENAYKVRLHEGIAGGQALEDAANARFPEAGWNIRDASEAAPSLQRNIERFSQFLTLVGLTALIVGGVGVANAVNAYLDGKRQVIATFKSLGAGGGFVVEVYLLQIMIMALVGVALGLVLGAVAPFVTARFLESVIPVAAEASIYPGALAIAAAFGLLTALAFALLPLGSTRDVAATALFRDASAGGRRIRLGYLAAALGLAAVIAGLALLMASDRFVAGTFLVATAVAFLILRLVAAGIQRLARRAPRVKSTPLRLAIGNIHRPGALTPSVVLSLGLGLTLLVTLAIIDMNLRREISSGIATRAPNFFFVDIQNGEIERFRSEIGRLAPGSTLDAAPMLRGRITKLGGVEVSKMEIPAEGGWVLRGDRGLTYAPTLPENSSLTAGEWWPADYTGEPLVSFSAEEAGELGLTIGQTITVNVLGRDVTAKIANFRTVEWESLSINFVMVFSPNTFAGAPHAWLATLAIPNATAETEKAVLSGIADAMPAVTTVRVKDALDAVNGLVAQLALAIRAAAAVALVASVLVLSGALAAGNRNRMHDAVVLKTLGGTRGTLIRAFVTEYMLLGLATAIFAIGAGAAAAWFVLATIMQLPFHFSVPLALATILVSLVLTVGFGLAGTWRVLGQKAAPVLREL